MCEYPKTPAGRVPQQLLGNPGVGVGVLAEGVGLRFAGGTGAASDGERHNDPVSNLEVLHAAAYLDHLAHELVAQDVAPFHGGHKAVIQMQVRPTDRR